jgi:transcriptional regulator with XRE-family HTH domain
MAANEIKVLIHDRGYTYESLAAEIGITAQAVSEIVNGRTKGSTARYAVAKALGVEVTDLWNGGAMRRASHPALRETMASKRQEAVELLQAVIQGPEVPGRFAEAIVAAAEYFALYERVRSVEKR